ncbi:hypothetical protein KJ969_00090 [Patescibacteria group bacterium]|nr:hypothetical protein [Patescibacteria group bacterium]MBU1921801.1 hypothetical protein [Patescibacteria group bacterium]
MSRSKKIFYFVLVLLIVVGAIVYYFIFIKPDIILEYGTVTPPAQIPKIDASVLGEDAFQGLKSYKALPLVPGATGNPLPFQEINFLGNATST